MKALKDLKEMLEEEVKKITKKGDITPTELESAYKVVDIIKDIETIWAMEDYSEDDGYSGRMSYGRYAYDDGMDMSYRRGRDARGRYVSRDGRSYRGYSMDGSKEAMLAKLEEAMHEATSEHERQMIMSCMEKLDR